MISVVLWKKEKGYKIECDKFKLLEKKYNYVMSFKV